MKFLLSLCIAVGASSAVAQTKDVNGNYSLSYTDSEGNEQTYLFIPSDKVRPSIKFKPSGRGPYTYNYQLRNDESSSQPIDHLDILVPDFDGVLKLMVEPPPGFTSSLESAEGNNIIRISTIPRHSILQRSSLILPGSTVSFSVTSSALAGIGKVRVFGIPPDIRCKADSCITINGEDEEIVQSPDLEKQATPLLDLSVDQFTAVPAITSTAGSDIVTGIRREIATWPLKGQASQAFVAHADSRLEKLGSALSANRSGDARSFMAKVKTFVRSTAATDLSEVGASVLLFDLDRLVREKRVTGR